jgi:hypothetical protein
MPWGIAAGAAIGLIGSSMQADAAGDAADAQERSAEKADATQRYMYDTTRADNAQFLGTGQAANNRLSYLLGLSSSAGSDPASGSLLRNFSQADMDADPVYQSGLQFGLDEGRKGLNNQAAANGSLNSGAVLKALTRFGNDYGSTKAGDAYNRYKSNRDSTFNMLSGVSGTGQVASNQVGAAGQNMANNVSQNQLAVGNARGASAIARGNALSGGLTGAYNGYQQYQAMNASNNPSNAGYWGGDMSAGYAGYGQQRDLSGYDAPANGGWGIE